MTEYYKLTIDDKLLQSAREAVSKGKENDWSMDKIADEFRGLVEEQNVAVFTQEQANAALEQASYILNFEDGYVEDREYPVKQEI